MNFRKTKIICTLGPAVDSDDIVRELMLTGMNVCRLNMSHGDYAEHQQRIDRVKRIRKELGLPVALLLDTKGPEIRTGCFENDKTHLDEGDKVIISHDDILGTKEKFSISYKELYLDIETGSRILIDDGLIELQVTGIKNKDIYCTVLNGGDVSNRKSINVPDAKLNLPSLTDKDREDILFAVKNDFDFIAASFVRKARDVQEIRNILDHAGEHGICMISKIENKEGIDNFEEILKVSDGIMVARGDLGVEIPAAEVPAVQKRCIQSCHQAGKISITATQMLDSMIRNPRPTRAEVSDVANAIYDGTSAVMLSGETASGKYPIESLKMMVEIAYQTENSIDYWSKFETTKIPMVPSIGNAISHATCTTAMDINAKAIISLTHAGRTARMLSRFRPECPIISTTVFPKVERQLNLSWGVMPILIDEVKNTDELFEAGIKAGAKSGLLSDGDLVVLTGGTPVGMSGTTNTIKVQTIGKALASGKSVCSDSNPGIITGTILNIKQPDHVDIKELNIPEDCILVAPYTTNDMLPIIKQSKVLVVEDDDPSCHTATIAMALEIPTILSCTNATKILTDGRTVTVDPVKGCIS
ncbi:MAG: pyruvate kinase [Clostridia bacterium]|nr:pyruvate kinase [Clostridia bacterium]